VRLLSSTFSEKELNRAMTGWIPAGYYCTSCGYRGTLFLERAPDSEGVA
jgi:hypothetical protein